MTDPFAWMAGQIERAVAAQLPPEYITLSPMMQMTYKAFHDHGRRMDATEYGRKVLRSPNPARHHLKQGVKAGFLVVVEPATRNIGAKYWLRGRDES